MRTCGLNYSKPPDRMGPSFAAGVFGVPVLQVILRVSLSVELGLCLSLMHKYKPHSLKSMLAITKVFALILPVLSPAVFR